MTNMKRQPIRVVLADDHVVVRQAIKRLLNHAPEIEVVGEARNGIEAIERVEELAPDVLLLDIEMPEMGGIEVARRLNAQHSQVNILILSAYDEPEYMRSLFEIGVAAYLIKDDLPFKIIDAIRNIRDIRSNWSHVSL